MKHRVQWWLLALILLQALHAPAAPDRQQLEGAYIEFPPLSYTDDNGEPAGTYIEKVNRLSREAGYDIRWRSLPIDRIYLYLRQGDIDFWLGSSGVPALKASTREPDFTFQPIRLNAYYTDNTDGIEDLEDLKGESVILIRGYTYLDRLSPVTQAERTRVDKAPDHKAALRMLRAERADYLLDFQSPVESALEKESIPGINKHLLMEWNTSLVFSKHTEHLDRIIRDFEAAWQAIGDRLRSSARPMTTEESQKRASDARSKSPEEGGSLHGSTTGPD